MIKLLTAAAGTAVLAVAIGAGVTQLGGDVEQADVAPIARVNVAKAPPAAPKAATKPRAANLSSAADEKDPNGDDGSGPAEENGRDEAQGPDDSGNDP